MEGAQRLAQRHIYLRCQTRTKRIYQQAVHHLEALEDSKVRMEIHVVSDGISAMAFLHREGEYADKPRPDLIFLDLNLPLMDGREVLKKIKGDPDLTEIPVVVLTTSEDEGDILKAYQLHASCYISKPVDFFKFTEIVKQIEGFWLQLVKLPRRENVQ